MFACQCTEVLARKYTLFKNHNIFILLICCKNTLKLLCLGKWLFVVWSFLSCSPKTIFWQNIQESKYTHDTIANWQKRKLRTTKLPVWLMFSLICYKLEGWPLMTLKLVEVFAIFWCQIGLKHVRLAYLTLYQSISFEILLK